MSMEEIRFTAIFSDNDDEDLIKELEEVLEFDECFGNNIVVNNLPIVGMDKFEKLELVVRDIFFHVNFYEDHLWMPVDPRSNKTLGYCFLEFKDPEEDEDQQERKKKLKEDEDQQERKRKRRMFKLMIHWMSFKRN